MIQRTVSAPKFDSRVIAQVTPRYKPIYSTLSVELKRSDIHQNARTGNSIAVFRRDSFADAVPSARRAYNKDVSDATGGCVNASIANSGVFAGIANQFGSIRADFDLCWCQSRGKSRLCFSDAIEREWFTRSESRGFHPHGKVRTGVQTGTGEWLGCTGEELRRDSS